MHMVRYACTFTAEKQDIIRAVSDVSIGQGGLGGGENEPAAGGCPPLLETVPADMARERRRCNIIHARPFQIAVGNIETGRLDDVHAEA
ncbi:hypothetical protein D3C72_1284000 [compost metagenome]